MATQFKIIGSATGFDVFARDLLAQGERSARRNDLAKNGWPEAEAERELRDLEAFRPLNESKVPLDLALDYVFHYASPGDFVRMPDGALVQLMGLAAA